MDIYSSDDSSDNDKGSGIKTLDFSNKYFDTQSLFNDIEHKIHSESKQNKPDQILSLNLYKNILTDVPENISKFFNLRKIDLGGNKIQRIPDFLTRLPLLSLILKNNNLDDDSFPKSFENLGNTLENMNICGNNLKTFPEVIFDLEKLKYLYLGQNHIGEIPSKIRMLKRLEILSLGGNELHQVPNSLCHLHELKALILSDNQLESVPACIANLKKLRTLQLHRNKLRTLPTEIVTLKYLSELSLRENPLVDKFVCDMVYNPPTLKELSGRVIKLYNIPYKFEDVPGVVYNYLQSAHHCINPNCKGVYFDNRVEQIKFVDFCGKYRLPLLQYLCSSKCINHSDDKYLSESNISKSNLKHKVLLG